MNTEFYKPADLRSATALLERYGDRAAIVNGGTDIVIEIARKRIAPEALIYVEGVAELQGIREEDGTVILGGAVTYLAMQQSPVCRAITGLMQALAALGSPAVRAVATPAGNIGTAAPSADCTTMLMALEAAVVLAGARGERTVPLDVFFLKRGETAMRRTELIKEIRFPVPGSHAGTGYARVARRKAQDIGKVLAGVALRLDGDVCARASVALGALNATAVRAPSIERAIAGKTRAEALAFVEENFPPEAGLRESYFKRYKELVTTAVIARALDAAWQSAASR